MPTAIRSDADAAAPRPRDATARAPASARRALAAAIALLRSGRFARGVLLYLTLFSGVAAWLPWTGSDPRPPPRWAVATGVDHPFSSWPFLAGVAALFASTLACTWGRRARVVALWRGARPPGAIALDGAAEEVARFLATRGFHGAGPVRRRFGPALFGGWLLHVGLLALVAGVLVQQAFHDAGNFALSEGERADLSEPGVVFDRERGPLAPARPPALSVGLDHFDPFLVQAGYAPDRFSRLLLEPAGGAEAVVDVDRASGIELGGVTVYQAIPTGLSLLLDIEGIGIRTLHLQHEGPTRSAARAVVPGGGGLDLVLDSERPLGSRAGTGRLQLAVGEGRRVVSEGEWFRFGTARARLLGYARWGGFSYARSPGKPAAWAGIAIVLLGCALLVFPAGVARVDPSPDGATAWVFVARGAEVLEDEWRTHRARRAAPES